MGLYDYVMNLPGMEDEVQVKCWDPCMNMYTLGSKVPDINGHFNYQIALREGGYLIILDGTIHNWQRNASANLPCFDKYGEQAFTGLLKDESYLHDSDHEPEQKYP
jgi:hypothetical protein